MRYRGVWLRHTRSLYKDPDIGRHCKAGEARRRLGGYYITLEGGIGGGETIVKEGVLDNIDAVFAIHVDPKLPTGEVSSKSGPYPPTCTLKSVDP